MVSVIFYKKGKKNWPGLWPDPIPPKNRIIILGLDNKIIDDVNYNGFPLRNFGFGLNGWYSRVTVEECQYLCEISDLCRYFNFNFNYVAKPSSIQYENICELKFGGTKKEAMEGNGAFGHKYSSGNTNTFVKEGI